MSSMLIPPGVFLTLCVPLDPCDNSLDAPLIHALRYGARLHIETPRQGKQLPILFF